MFNAEQLREKLAAGPPVEEQNAGYTNWFGSCVANGAIEALKQEALLTAMVEDGILVTNSAALVAQFHTAFGVPVLDAPQIPAADRVALRVRLLREEFDEFIAAVESRDFAAVAHELADLQIVLDGTFLEFGLGSLKPHLVNAVHASNMSKLGGDGQPVTRDDGKVMKGPNYQPPDIAALLSSLAEADA